MERVLGLDDVSATSCTLAVISQCRASDSRTSRSRPTATPWSRRSRGFPVASIWQQRRPASARLRAAPLYAQPGFLVEQKKQVETPHRFRPKRPFWSDCGAEKPPRGRGDDLHSIDQDTRSPF